MRLIALALAITLSACSPPRPQQSEPPPAPPAPVVTCNSLSPDLTKLVEVQEGAAVPTAAAELRGGTVAPGTYDLTSATRVGGATGWRGARAVALGVSESDDGVVLNWAGVAAGQAIDSWTATLHETPTRLSYSCGRVGDVDAAFHAQGDMLQLRIQDGASGALEMTFARRP